MYLLWPACAFCYLVVSPFVSYFVKKPIVLDSFDLYMDGRDEPLHTQVWTTNYCAIQYHPFSRYLGWAQRDIVKAVKYADELGVKYCGLGALNKVSSSSSGSLAHIAAKGYEPASQPVSR